MKKLIIIAFAALSYTAQAQSSNRTNYAVGSSFFVLGSAAIGYATYNAGKQVKTLDLNEQRRYNSEKGFYSSVGAVLIAVGTFNFLLTFENKKNKVSASAGLGSVTLKYRF